MPLGGGGGGGSGDGSSDSIGGGRGISWDDPLLYFLKSSIFSFIEKA